MKKFIILSLLLITSVCLALSPITMDDRFDYKDVVRFFKAITVQDDIKLGFGSANDVTLEYDEDGNDELLVTGNVGFGNIATIRGGINSEIVTVTDEAGYDILAANTGKLHVIADLSQDTTLDLPAEAAGLYYKFIYVGAAAESHDHNIDSESDTNFFIGGIAFADTDAGEAADEINTGVYSDGDSNSILNLLNIAAGTVIEIYCDGTNWYLFGIVFSDTVPTFADQS